MKKILALVGLLALAGCEGSTQYGSCIGVGSTEQPKLRYDYSARNIVLAVIFSETLFVPLVVVLCDAQCPVGKLP